MTSEPAQTGTPTTQGTTLRPIPTERVSGSSTDSSAEPISEPEPPPTRDGDLDLASASGESRLAIALQNPGRYAQVASRKLRPWVVSMVAAVAPEAQSFTVRFVSDRAMRGMNRTYRKLDKPTDVLSFPGDLVSAADAGPSQAAQPDGQRHDGGHWPAAALVPEADDAGGEASRHLGDVAISVPTAERQARAAGHTLERELRTLILHGVLHCLGYDHEVDDGTMERFEAQLRTQWLDSQLHDGQLHDSQRHDHA